MIKQDIKEKKIMQLVKILCNNFLSKQELTEKLDIKPATLAQYLSIIKASGFELNKKKKKYNIKTFDNKIYFDELDNSMFAHIAVLADLFLPQKKSKELKGIIDAIIHKSTIKNAQNYKEKYEFFKEIKQKTRNKNKIETFQKALDKNLNLKVILNTSLKEHTLKPLKFNWGVDKVFLVFLDLKENKIKEIPLQKIVKMSFLEQENFIEQNDDIIFELYDKLAKRYVLKENETILEKAEDKIVVLNSSKEPQKLFRRLLRYEDLCKVTYPKKANEQFKEILKKSLDNITKLNHN